MSHRERRDRPGIAIATLMGTAVLVLACSPDRSSDESTDPPTLSDGNEGRPGQGVLVSFADDLVILCGTPERADTARQITIDALATVGLQLHPNKTRIVCLRGGREGFVFLGFHHHKVESWKKRGRYYLQRWPSQRAIE